MENTKNKVCVRVFYVVLAYQPIKPTSRWIENQHKAREKECWFSSTRQSIRRVKHSTIPA